MAFFRVLERRGANFRRQAGDLILVVESWDLSQSIQHAKIYQKLYSTDQILIMLVNKNTLICKIKGITGYDKVSYNGGINCSS